jgi:hypothetical protein
MAIFKRPLAIGIGQLVTVLAAALLAQSAGAQTETVAIIPGALVATGAAAGGISTTTLIAVGTALVVVGVSANTGSTGTK